MYYQSGGDLDTEVNLLRGLGLNERAAFAQAQDQQMRQMRNWVERRRAEQAATDAAGMRVREAIQRRYEEAEQRALEEARRRDANWRRIELNMQRAMQEAQRVYAGPLPQGTSPVVPASADNEQVIPARAVIIDDVGVEPAFMPDEREIVEGADE